MDETLVRKLAAVMAVVALSLAVASALHLAGLVHGRGEPYDADDAGIAEAVIGLVLAAAAAAMVRAPARARTVGLAATGFAIAGFGVGLTITTQGGHAPDIAYHLAVLPILVGTLSCSCAPVTARLGRPPAVPRARWAGSRRAGVRRPSRRA